MRYLDPKADLTFKKVFGEHPDLVISLLNALLPFDREEDEIQYVEYLSAELVPRNPLRKNSIVDVRCRDRRGRQFIVEMQMVWSKEFKQRVLFNASKAYVRQLGEGEHFESLQPVYSLNLVNEVFEPELEGYYHYYRLVHVEHTEKVLEGLHLVFVELPKFTPQTYSEKKMHVLWLRYLTEIDSKTREVAPELLESPEIRKAVGQIEESAFTEAQMYSYDEFWDIIRRERGMVYNLERAENNLRRAEEKARQAEERAEKATEEGRMEGIRATAVKMKAEGLPMDIISRITGLSVEELSGI